MNTLLAEPPPAQAGPEETSASGGPGAPPVDIPEPAPAPGRACANCGAPLGEAQDWCLQCGAGAPGSLTAGGPSWRSAATILAAAAVLAIAAAAAAYAALSKGGPPRPRPVTATVPQTPPPTVPPTATPTTPGAIAPTPNPTTPKLPGTGIPKSLLPKGTAKPPKIPLTTPTPKTPPKTLVPAPIGPTTTPKATQPSGGTTTEAQPQALTLDTNAAATYNPYSYPASDFGDPSLAIDGETATGWTAQVEPSVAPRMAEGLVLDLKSARRLSALTLVTSTPGMTVQVYGAAGSAAPPTSITDPAWTRLSPALVVKKRSTHLKLKAPSRAFRFVTLWISKAPASAVGTSQAPGHVSVNELELFPAK
jgi:hypothetical protein